MSPESQPDSTASAPTPAAVVEAGKLRAALDGAAAVVDECLLEFDRDGLTLGARDPADVAMAELRLPSAVFEAYAADGERFGVALGRLVDAVSMIDAARPARLALVEDGRLRIEAGDLEYALAPLDPDSVRQVAWIDDRSPAVTATFSSDDLQRAIDAAALVADHATIRADPDAGTLSVAASGDTDDIRVEFAGDDLDAFDPGAAEAIYSVDYLERIVRAIPGDATVTIEYDDDDPLGLDHPVAGDGAARWLVAPRIRG